jgi:hypothetical protein
MVKRKVVIKQSVAIQIAETSWFIESKGLKQTALNFSDSVYDFIEKLADKRKKHRICRDPKWAQLIMKCVNFKKKYTVAFIETESEITVCEFVPNKSVWW